MHMDLSSSYAVKTEIKTKTELKPHMNENYLLSKSFLSHMGEVISQGKYLPLSFSVNKGVSAASHNAALLL